MLSFYETLPWSHLTGFIEPAKSRCFCRNTHTFADRLQATPTQPLNDEFMVVTLGHLVVWAAPFVLWAPRFTDAIEPGVQRLVVVLDRVVFASDKSEAIMIAHLVERSSWTDRFLASLASQEHFNVHHIVLDDGFRVVVLGWVEDQVTWAHFFFFQIDGASIELVALIARSQFEPEVFAQIIHSLPHQGTTVKKERCWVQWVVFLAVALGIWHTQILLALTNEFLSEPVFVLLRSVTLLVKWFARLWYRLSQLWPFLRLYLDYTLPWWRVRWIVVLVIRGVLPVLATTIRGRLTAIRVTVVLVIILHRCFVCSVSDTRCIRRRSSCTSRIDRVIIVVIDLYLVL